MGSAILIVITLHGQAIYQADAMVTTWERCSEKARDINVNTSSSMEAFCVGADGMRIGDAYVKGGK